MSSPFTIREGSGPVVAASIHAGHEVREEVAAIHAVPGEVRLREEDPFTDRLCAAGDSGVEVRVSRFEVDLNRPRETAVYRSPDDAWGIRLYRRPPGAAVIARSLELYDAFYSAVERLLDGLSRRHDRVLVLDLHSYCHRRRGPAAPPDDPTENPDVNLGTETLDRAAFGDALEAVARELSSRVVGGGRLDVRENVRFCGGAFPRWVNGRFPGRVGAIAVEIKKVFMDEWTGALYEERFVEIEGAIRAAADAARARLSR